jgi:hypothetical protein
LKSAFFWDVPYRENAAAERNILPPSSGSKSKQREKQAAVGSTMSLLSIPYSVTTNKKTFIHHQKSSPPKII